MNAILLQPAEVASVFMNGAALMLLISIFLTTAIYRERGRLDDRLFFYMILVDAVIAVCDAISYVVDAHRFPFARTLTILSNTTMLFSLTVFAALFIALIHYRIYREEERTRKLGRLLIAVEAVILLADLLNIPFGYFFHINEQNVFVYEPIFILQTIMIYGLMAVGSLMALFAKITGVSGKYIPAGMLLLLLVPDLVANFLIYDLSVYAVTRSILLCYLHMAILNEEFYARGGNVACR